jgi:hypothetical protein
LRSRPDVVFGFVQRGGEFSHPRRIEAPFCDQRLQFLRRRFVGVRQPDDVFGQSATTRPVAHHDPLPDEFLDQARQSSDGQVRPGDAAQLTHPGRVRQGALS